MLKDFESAYRVIFSLKIGFKTHGEQVLCLSIIPVIIESDVSHQPSHYAVTASIIQETATS